MAFVPTDFYLHILLIVSMKDSQLPLYCQMYLLFSNWGNSDVCAFVKLFHLFFCLIFKKYRNSCIDIIICTAVFCLEVDSCDLWAICIASPVQNMVHCKKRLAIFPSPAGMWLVRSRLGMGKSLFLFLQCEASRNCMGGT